MVAALDTNKFDSKHLQPGVVCVYFKLTGAGAAAFTGAASSDNDNRLITTQGYTSTGLYPLTLNMAGRVFMGASASFETQTATTFYALTSAKLSSGVLTLQFLNDAHSAIDIISGDIVHLRVWFKNSGA